MRIRLVVGLLLAAVSIAAADDDVDCNNAMAQQDMNHCAYLDYEAADAELNAVWKEARKAAKELDAELSDDLKGADKALLAAQRAWITYRDSQCELAGVRGTWRLDGTDAGVGLPCRSDAQADERAAGIHHRGRRNERPAGCNGLPRTSQSGAASPRTRRIRRDLDRRHP